MTRHMPFWLSPENFTTLRSFLSSENLIQMNGTLESIRMELGVAKVRTSSLVINADILSSALGLQKGSIPIYLNDVEKIALLQCKDLPKEIHEILQ